MKAKYIYTLILLALAGVGGVYLIERTRRKKVSGTVGTGRETVKGSNAGVSLKDPCPDTFTIWDAETETCIPLVEEPVPLTKNDWS